jgi:hypothetical protein
MDLRERYIRVRTYGLDASGSGEEQVEVSCEQCNEFSGSIKGGIS